MAEKELSSIWKLPSQRNNTATDSTFEPGLRIWGGDGQQTVWLTVILDNNGVRLRSFCDMLHAPSDENAELSSAPVISGVFCT